MKRGAAASAAVILALAVAACGGGSSGSGSSGGGSSGGGSAPAAYNGKPVTITFWNPFTGRELGVMKHVIAGFEQANPNVKVTIRGGISDNNIIAAIRGGSPPDLAMSNSADNLGEYCGTGAWINLGPYIQRDHVDVNQFPHAVQDFTEFDGDRCALPDLADTYGLYYNKALLAKAGITSLPKTFTELTADAKKLTQFNPDGSIKVAGFVPTSTFYENAAAHYAPLWGFHWVQNGKAAMGTDPNWSAYLRWEKQLIDWYGTSKLSHFLSAAGEEFSPTNDFEQGKIAMQIDGEWRTQFIKSDHAKISYSTAPMPVNPADPSLYGGGYTTGNVMGIPKGATHPAAAWLLAKYLATNRTAVITFANGLGNVPTLTSALSDPTLTKNPEFATFLKIFGNPNTATDPITAIGSANQTMEGNWQQKWEAGSIPASQLESSLKNLAAQINAQEANSTQGSGPP
jgi:multiple sugar transport system substrate-binding protein